MTGAYHFRSPVASQPLNSWKEIAAYLGRGVRTVQRWQHYGLPVHRPAGHPRAAVIALPAELDQWLKESTVLKSDREHLLKRIDDLEDEVERLLNKCANLEMSLRIALSKGSR